MKVLVIGSGGREHAIVWKLRQSPKVSKIYCAPGNGGIAKHAECVSIKADDIAALLEFAQKNKVELTVVGPEAALAAGIVDEFTKAGLKIFGPVKELARLESSKAYAKEAMKRFGIPTADFKIFQDVVSAKNYVLSNQCRDLINQAPVYPLVIKADGLAAGKGVIICKDKEEAASAIDDIMVKKVFGASQDKIVIEECLQGEEASFLVVSDGENFIPLASSQDHKRALDGDKGPNTGGMGAYSPAPVVDEKMRNRIIAEIISPLIKGLAKEGKFYKGVLYAGIMITKAGPKVLEFNCRFGDPETQAILPRLKTDLVDICLAGIEGRIDKINIEWKDRAAVCVVLAAAGYPGDYKKGLEIEGLEDAVWKAADDTYIFHAGTVARMTDYGRRTMVTNGGRVLNVVSLGGSIKEAIGNTYNAVTKIKFDGMHYRKDIGRRALERNP